VKVANINTIKPRTFPARRTSTNLVGGQSPVQAEGFCIGRVVLDARGGQVPWHNHEQEEIYHILTGEGEMCVGDEARMLRTGDVVYIPSGAFHQLTNTGKSPLEFIYCYSPAGDVAHWRQELEGTLPRAGVDAPELPPAAAAQYAANSASG
jgi:mannose-6-phosphate isomerase-like protein (cupin superfamily)